MVGIITFILVFVLLGLFLGVFNLKNYVIVAPNKYGGTDDKVNNKLLAKLAVLALVSLLSGIFNPLDFERIDSGNIGLKIDRIGNNQGVPVAIPVKGIVWYNSFLSDIVEFSVRYNPVEYKDFDVVTKGGFPIKVSPTFNYQVRADKAVELYINLLKGSEFEEIEKSWLKTATKIALNNVTNTYTIDSIFNYKSQYQKDVEAEMEKQISSYFHISQINPGVTPPAELAEVIKSKTESIQEAQKAELNRIKAETEAAVKIAEARGDSSQKVIAAAAEAEAMKLQQKQISALYVRYLEALKWNGAYPNTLILGGGSNFNPNFLMNLK